MFKKTLLILALLGLSPILAQQTTERTIAFYNVENLFDIQDDTLVFDDARTPTGYYKWTQTRFIRKIDALAGVISKIGMEERQAPPDLLGLCEVENAAVLQELVAHPLLQPYDYGTVHLDSPDERGIDVALLYKQNTFYPASVTSRTLLLQDKKLRRDRTRDQLVITGWLEDIFVGCIINHWPSRRGGEKRSEPYRLQAAQLNRKIVDSLRSEHPDIFIFNMGDFNDNPTDTGMEHILFPLFKIEPDLYNPMKVMYRKGFGTLAYRDRWSLFDQILIDMKLITNSPLLPRLYQVGIYNPPELVTPIGRYKGYPFSTYSAGRYQGGVSDHFPVYVILKIPLH